MPVTPLAASGASRATAPVPDNITALFLQSTLARAADLARAGHYGDADNLLLTLPAEQQESVPCLDLRARMRAQRGQFRQAESFWTRGLQVEPGSPACEAGLRWIADARSPDRRLVSLVAMISLGVLVLAFFLIARNIRRQLTGMHGLFTANTSTATREPSPSAALLAEVESRVAMRGVSVHRKETALLVMLDDGAFLHATALRPGAGALLTRLGRALEPYADSLVVEVVGCTDSEPVPSGHRRFRDNYALGLARAVVVVEHLRRTTELPTRAFLASSAELPVFSGDTLTGARSKQRTVVIRVSVRPVFWQP